MAKMAINYYLVDGNLLPAGINNGGELCENLAINGDMAIFQ
jgi:hypothetical protein